MALKAVLETLDDVPEAFQELYKEASEGVFVLGVDGIDEHPAVKSLKTALDRQKEQRAAQAKQLTEAKAALEAFGDLTPDQLEELRAAAEAGGKVDETAIEKMVAARVGATQRKLEGMIESLTAERDEAVKAHDGLKQTLADEKIANMLLTAAGKAGVRKNAISTLQLMGQGVWKIDDDGKPIAMNGDEPLMGSRGPMPVDDWIESLRSDHDYLFEPSSGAGAQGSGADPGRGGRVLRLDQGPNVIGENLEAIAKGEARIA